MLLTLKWAAQLNYQPLLVEMGPDPIQAYFWTAANKRPTRLLAEYCLTQSEEILF